VWTPCVTKIRDDLNKLYPEHLFFHAKCVFSHVFFRAYFMLHILLSITLAIASFSKTEYFKVIQGKDAKSIQKLISTLDQSTASSDRTAYLGALTMKSATLKETPKEKMEVFKKGKDLLEKAITANKKNTEYRFLRLIIQENAPKILKYSSNKTDDAAWIKEHYSSCSSEIIQVIKNYAAQSIVLEL
jgi:hypothetical protein